MHNLSAEIIKPGNLTPFQIRYKVFVEENGFIKSNFIPMYFSKKMLEKDGYDDYAFHIVVYLNKKDNKKPIAAARVVLDSDYGLPINRHFIHNIDRKLNFICEMSRISILKQYQKTKALEIIFSLAYIISRYILKVDFCLINANPDTHSIYYANNLYNYLVGNSFLHPVIQAEPLENNCNMVYNPDSFLLGEQDCFVVPNMIKKYINMNFRVIGFPIYIPKYNMCGMPMALHLNEFNVRYDKHFKRITNCFDLPDKEFIVSDLISNGHALFIKT